MDILVFLEEQQGKIHRMSREAVVAAQQFAQDHGLKVSALILGDSDNVLSAEAADFGVDECIIAAHPLLDTYSADGFTTAFAQIIQTENPRYIFMGHSYMVRDFIPRVSARLHCPFIGDVIGVTDQDGSPAFIKQVFNAKMVTDVHPVENGPVLVSFQAATYPAEKLVSGSPARREVPINLAESDVRATSEEPFQEASGGVDLTAADLIISIGRGIGKQENIPVAEALAKKLNAELASSRPLVDAGWMPPQRQVGSSGQSVSPKLYFALGISGAIQHVIGMKGSKNVVAINKDPDAPIFEIADYGIVGDILELMPLLTEAIP
ncbi:MAG: electron transfer flavoprotein subunit alpha/FixB family protein [FCB group bacterium]|nr:electron transfer flavoprotein subunit alpha/FixB family protein [FCB group bacterium]